MYIFMKEGPIHLCHHRDKEATVIARGWNLEALRLFAGKYADKIWYDEDADYYWRVEVPKEYSTAQVAAAANRIDYPTLKASVNDADYYNLLVDVHAVEKEALDERSM